MIRDTCLKYWRLAVLTPAIYLAICLAVDYWVFAGRVEPGFYRLEEARFEDVSRAGMVVAAGLSVLILLLKKFWWMRPAVLEYYKTYEANRQALVFRYVCLLMLCDLIVFSGMILYLMQGQFRIFLYFAFLGMLAYAANYPPAVPLDQIYQNEKNHNNEK